MKARGKRKEAEVPDQDDSDIDRIDLDRNEIIEWYKDNIGDD